MTDETQTQETEAPQATETPSQEAPQETTQEAQSPPDVSEQIAALAKEVAALKSPAPDAGPRSIDDLLNSTPEDPQQVYDPYGQGVPPTQGGQPQVQEPEQNLDPQQAEALFQQAIQERVQDAVYPYLESIDREMRRQQLTRMTEQFPELKDPEVVRAVHSRLAPVAERYDDPSLLSDPELVAQAVMAERAQRAAGSEVPAEQARNQGASLETGQGATAPQSEEDPIEAFKRDLLGPRGGGDAFT